MLNMINQYASVCILNKKDKPLIRKKEIEAIMEDKKIYINCHPYVDLCLPSKTLWSTMNVGASKPSEYGLYFQWGDVQGYTFDQVGLKKKFSLDWSDYKWYSGKKDEYGDVAFTKYNTPGASLELEDDAAHVNMGGSWHIPTPSQIQELIDNTTSEWTTQDGVNGRLFTSKTDNSKSIFIPAAGIAWNGSVYNSGSNGLVWSSMLNAGNVDYGQNLYFYSSNVILNYYCRYSGLSVRGVIG
jgi:hypothetical protein